VGIKVNGQGGSMVDFVAPMANKDIAACELIITQLNTETDNRTSWEQALISLITAVETHYDHHTLLAILAKLPTEIKNELFSRLLSTVDKNAPILNTLIHYVADLPEKNVHTTKLIIMLLNYPIPLDYPQVPALLLKLEGKEKAELLGQIIHQKNYAYFLLYLAIKASRNEETLHQYLSESPQLANMIMSQLLEAPMSDEDHRKKVLCLLTKNSLFNWNDTQFYNLAHNKLELTLAKLPREELQKYFKEYVNASPIHHHISSRKIKLLDALYVITNEINRVTSCLDAADDCDHTLTINFLTSSKTTNRDLRKACLKKIKPLQLAGICGHLIVLGQQDYGTKHEVFSDFIDVFCGYLNGSESPLELLKELAAQLKVCPPAEEERIIKAILNHLKSAEHQSLWLHILIKLYKNRTVLLPYCFEFIMNQKEKTQHTLSLLQLLTNDELLALYLMSSVHAVNKNTNSLKQFFASKENRPQLFYLISNTPTIEPHLLLELINSLDDNHLLNLIEILLHKVTLNSEFKATLHQLLLIFCERLKNKSTTSIHEWSSKPFADALIDYLLLSPECVYQLSVPNHRFSALALINRSYIADALQLRIDKVLNWRVIDPEKINNIALTWLHYFYSHPHQLHELFTNLHYSEINRKEVRNSNVSALKHACWKLIHPGRLYDDNVFRKMFIKPVDGLFDSVIPLLAEEECLTKDPHHGALWLAKTAGTLSLTMNHQLLITLLIHSLHQTTLSNWTHAANWLGSLSLDNQVVFIKQLINKVNLAENNPNLSIQTYQLITQNAAFSVYFPQLSEVEWVWIIKNTPLEQLMKIGRDWFHLIIGSKGLEQINFGKIFQSLPQNEDLINNILEEPFFDNPLVIAKIFRELATESDCASQFVCLHQLIKNHSSEWVNQFLKSTIPHIMSAHLNTTVLHVLNVLILNRSTDMSSNNLEDTALVSHYLRLLHSLIHQQTNYHELKQLTLSILNAFTHRDYHWNQLIFNEPAFITTAIIWLKNTDFTTLQAHINDHPLTYLIIDAGSPSLNSPLKDHELMQNFLKILLLNPPQNLNNDRFMFFFKNWLSPENRIALANQILARYPLCEVHLQSFSLLTDTLNPNDLYLIFTQQNNSWLLAKELLTHPKGIDALLPEQWQVIGETISTSGQIINLLNSQTPITSRINCVALLFTLYGKTAAMLSQKLGEWFITSPALAMLANFTIKEEHQKLLNEVLEEKIYYGDFLYDYLANPTLDMPINPDSYLYKLVRGNYLTSSPQKPSHVQFFKYLTAKDQVRALKKELTTAHRMQHLSELLYPFKDGEEVLLPLLLSAQWHYQLNLISQGFLTAIHFYTTSNSFEVIQAIQQTEFYKNYLHPLLIYKNPVKTTGFFPYLIQYAEALSPVSPDHAQTIKNTIKLHQEHLKAMRHYSVPRIYDYFQPESPLSLKINPDKNVLSLEDSTLLRSAHTLQAESLSKQNIYPKERFAQLFNIISTNSELVNNEHFNKWLFLTALFSPISALIEDNKLKNYLATIPLNSLVKLIKDFWTQEQDCLSIQSQLTQLKKTETCRDLIYQLLSWDFKLLNQLLRVTEFLNLSFLKELALFTLELKVIKLTEPQMTALFLTDDLSKYQDIEWVEQDLHQMQERLNHVSMRLNDLFFLGFGYHADFDNDERLYFLTREQKFIGSDTLVKCFNSYLTLFSPNDYRPAPLLKTLTIEPHILEKNINFLDSQLIEEIIKAAVKFPETYSPLLEALINSKHNKRCMEYLTEAMQLLLTEENSSPRLELTQISPARLQQLSEKDVISLLALQRLAFFNKPITELHDRPHSINSQDSLNWQYFCADTSLYASVITVEKATGHSLEQGKLWLRNQGDMNLNRYHQLIDNMNVEQLIKYPNIHYHWLCWLAFLNNHDQTILSAGIINWVHQLTKNQLNNTPQILNLIAQAGESHQLFNLLQLCTDTPLADEQKQWLSKIIQKKIKQYSLSAPSHSVTKSISQESSMGQNNPFNLDLLLIAINNEEYVANIVNEPQNQKKFVANLTSSNFEVRDLLTLIKRANNPHLKSLLIRHLLSQQSSLDALDGRSLLIQIAKETHEPPRLNRLIYQIATEHLTEESIAKLPAETAVNLLYSIPHFHQLSQNQVHYLIKQHPDPNVISYWLKHYSNMPNAQFMLAHFFKEAEPVLKKVIKKMQSEPVQKLFELIVRHLDLFNPKHNLLYEYTNESLFILAAGLYIHGHQSEAYSVYIEKIIPILTKKNHEFSLIAVQMLMELKLTAKNPLIQFNDEVTRIINESLRYHAQTGITDLFYSSGQINGSILLPIIKSQTKTTLKHEEQIKESRLVNLLTNGTYQLSTLDYFLVHYKGSTDKLSQLILDYLQFFERENNKIPYQHALQHTAKLMNNMELDFPIREVLFNSFLACSTLLDQEISYTLLIYNINKTIHHFGLKGGASNYKQVIDLCNLALAKLNPKTEQEKRSIATQAKAEALFELESNKHTGFFARIIQWFKRCWMYGWSGFFSPKVPFYVAPATLGIARSNPVNNEPDLAAKPKKELLQLLREKQEITRERFAEIINAIKLFSLQKKPAEEYKRRYELHLFFHRLILEAKKDRQLGFQLMEHQELFIENRKCLLELIVRQEVLIELEPFLELCNNDSLHFEKFTREMTMSLPNPLPESPTTKSTEKKTNLSEKVQQFAQDLFTNISSISATLFSFNKEKEVLPSVTGTNNNNTP